MAGETQTAPSFAETLRRRTNEYYEHKYQDTEYNPAQIAEWARVRFSEEARIGNWGITVYFPIPNEVSKDPSGIMWIAQRVQEMLAKDLYPHLSVSQDPAATNRIAISVAW